MGSTELTVLVVDDDFRVANMHAGIVNALPGFTVTTTATTLAAAHKADPVDLALVDVPSLGESPLSVEPANVGALGAVFGHPDGQDPVAVTPARVVLEEQAVGRDLYGVHTTTRDVLVLAAALAHGDSGGPLVDATGRVVGVAFAISADQSGTSYALSTAELNTALAESRTPGGAATGSCLTD